MTNTYHQYFANEAALLSFAHQLAHHLPPAIIIYLYGPLGAGKTTFTRGILRGLGFSGKVKSPSYTLVEPYDIQGHSIFHFDFYRLKDSSELEYIGIQDYFSQAALILIEWPEKAEAFLPSPDLACYISLVKEGRDMRLVAHSALGQAVLEHLK